MKIIITLFFLLVTPLAISSQTKSVLIKSVNCTLKWEQFQKKPTILYPKIYTKPTIKKVIPKKEPNTIIKSKKIELDPIIIKRSKLKPPKTEAVSFKSIKIENTEKSNLSSLQYKDNSRYNIKYSDKSHGFFTNSITSIAQDNYGIMWIASIKAGLCEYNGINQKIVKEENGLPSNSINHILFDSKNRLWVGTEKGICYIKDNKIFLPTIKNLKIPIRTIYEDKKGNIWIGTKQEGVYKFDGNNITNFNKSTGLNSNWVNSILEDSEGNYWFGINNSGFCKITKDYVYQYIANDNVALSTLSVFEDSNNNIWFGFFHAPLICYRNNSFFEYDFIHNHTERIFDIKENKNGLWFAIYGAGLINLKEGKQKYYSTDDGLPSRSVYKICIDKADNIWLANLYNGIGRFDDNSFFANNHKNEIPLTITEEIIKDKKNRTWYFPNGEMIIRDDSTHYTTFINEVDTIALSLNYSWDSHFLEDGSAWFATYSIGIAKFSEKEFRFHIFEKGNYILDISAKNDSNICFSTMKNGLIMIENDKFYSLTTKQGLISNEINTVFYDSKDNLWVGTNSGINILKNNKIAKLNKNTGLLSNKINYFYEDNTKRLWIGTEKGINIIDKHKIYSISTKNGLISNKIRSITKDTEGYFWIATNKGLSKIKFLSVNRYIITNYGKNYGLKVTDFNSSVLTFENGNISWGTNIGILNYQANKENAIQKPKLNICDINIKDNIKKMIIKPNEKFDISFVAIDWGFENEITYEYALVKVKKDTVWINIGKNNSLILKNKQAGNYKLLIRAKGHAGYSNIQTIDVIFLPKWWQTFWFRFLSVLFIIIAVKILYYIKQKQLRRANIKLEKTVIEKTDELKIEKEELRKRNIEKDALIQEIHHRVKNNLQTISSIVDMQIMSLKEETHKNILRNTHSRITAMALVHEMLYSVNDLSYVSTKKYISQLVSTIDEMINTKRISINFETKIDDVSIEINKSIALGMLASEVIANSIKYAFKHINKPKISLYLKYNKNSNQINFTISDNGTGIGKDVISGKQTSLGMRLINIFARQLKAELKIYNNEGTVLKLKFKK